MYQQWEFSSDIAYCDLPPFKVLRWHLLLSSEDSDGSYFGFEKYTLYWERTRTVLMSIDSETKNDVLKEFSNT